MRAIRVLGTLVLVTAVALGLLGLIGHFHDNTRSAAPPPDPVPTGAPVLATPSSAAGVPSSFSKNVSKKQARAALTPEGDLPPGWHAISGGDSDPKAVTTVPAGCGDRPSGVTLARASFALPGTEAVPGGTLDEIVYRPSNRPLTQLTTLRDRLAGCGTYTATSAAGSAVFQLGALPFPALGDGTLAMTARVRTGTIAGALTRTSVFVAVGPVVVHIDALAFSDTLPPSVLQQIVTRSIARLQSGTA